MFTVRKMQKPLNYKSKKETSLMYSIILDNTE